MLEEDLGRAAKSINLQSRLRPRLQRATIAFFSRQHHRKICYCSYDQYISLDGVDALIAYKIGSTGTSVNSSSPLVWWSVVSSR